MWNAFYAKRDYRQTSAWSLFCKDVMVSVVMLFCFFSYLRRLLSYAV
jgi:hypothetical protein